jgi:hypothetical protein
MPNDLPTSHRALTPDDVAHEDGLLMHELTVVNAMLGKYVLRYLDADARRADPIPTAEERSLADRLTAAADGIRTRAARRDESERP